MDINDIIKLLYGQQRQQQVVPQLLAQNERGQLLKDADEAFYGGGQGQAQPQPTPKPSPTPQKGKNFQFTA